MSSPALLARAFPHFLRWTGVLTALAGVQFLVPTQFLARQGLAVGDATGLFYARHWGLLVACLGLLLVWAAAQPALRRPVVIAAAVEKLALVLMVITNWNEPALQGLHAVLLLDVPCVLVYAAWLVGKKPSIDR